MTKPTTTLNIKPLADRIIVNDPRKPADKEIGGLPMADGIFIPEAARANLKNFLPEVDTAHYVVTALAVGDGCKSVKKGDKLVIAHQGLFPVRVGDVQFCGVGEANVVAVLE